MASKVGIVESINDGKFFAKDSLGNTKELKNGDIIYENDVVFSDGSNSSNSEIRVALEGEDIIILKNVVQQLFDSSLIASTFGDEEMVFSKESIEAFFEKSFDISDIEAILSLKHDIDFKNLTQTDKEVKENIKLKPLLKDAFYMKEDSSDMIIKEDIKQLFVENRKVELLDNFIYENSQKLRVELDIKDEIL